MANGLCPVNGVSADSDQLAGNVAYDPIKPPVNGCAALYHKKGCKPEFSREQANYLIANFLALVDKANLAYDCTDPLLLWKAIKALCICDGSSPSGYTHRIPFNYTGAEQTFTVPAGVTEIFMKLWAAGGGSGNPSMGAPGGFTSAKLPVTAGQVLKVIIGGGGGFTSRFGASATATGGYGLGGDGLANLGDLNRNEVGGGGGLSGLFLTSFLKANAWLIAGGGGGGGDSHNGGAGGDPAYAGGQASMTGQAGSASSDGGGGGAGGGYEGGNAGSIRSYPSWTPSPSGEGGKNFAIAGATDVISLFTPGFTPLAPNKSDIDYFGTIGDGGNVAGAGAVGSPGFGVLYY